MTNISNLFEYVVLDVNNVPQPVLWQKAREVIRDFCKFTRAWRLDIDTVPVKTNVKEYDIDDNPTGTEIVAVTDVKLDDRYLRANTDYKLQDDDLSVLILANYPGSTEGTGLEATLLLQPTLTADSIDDQLYRDYQEAFVDGLKAFLMLMQKKTWSDREMGAYYKREYEIKRTDARIREIRGKGLNPIMTARVGNALLSERKRA